MRSYEEDFKRLEEIIDLLQQENVTIDSSIELFKEAIELKKQCQVALDEAKNQVVVMLNENQEEVIYENI